MGSDNTVSMASHFFATRRLESHIAAKEARIAALEAALRELLEAKRLCDANARLDYAAPTVRLIHAFAKAEKVLNG